MMPVQAFEGCDRGRVEDDLQAAPLAGSAVRGGTLAPGQYLVGTTYLQLEPDKAERVNELVGPVLADLDERDGLLAMALGTSRSCGAARTLTVWRDEAAVFEFVVGVPHARAMQEIDDVSRGGSVATHWAGDETAVSLAAAATHLASDDLQSF